MSLMQFFYTFKRFLNTFSDFFTYVIFCLTILKFKTNEITINQLKDFFVCYLFTTIFYFYFILIYFLFVFLTIC